jgi:hypothetical protein
LCELTRPPTTTAQVARPLSTAQPDEPVVDQHLVARFEHVSDHRGRDRQLAVRRGRFRGDADLIPGVEDDRLGQLADAELRSLEVGDESDRAPDLGRYLAHEPRSLGVPLVRAMREVEADGIDAGRDQRAQALARVGSRPERRDDLRLAFPGHAGVQVSSTARVRR